MIMDGLETMSFADVAGIQFQQLLNFETFKAEMAASEDTPTPPQRRSLLLVTDNNIGGNNNNNNDSLNTPLASFMDLPIFSFGPSAMLPPPSGKTIKM